jgi:GH35 family endo-1,4-beta-xylanase
MDNYSWLPNGHVLPWDAAGQPKPAYYAIADALQGK